MLAFTLPLTLLVKGGGTCPAGLGRRETCID